MSTLSSSMNVAVSALYAQSAAVSTISNNLANSSTYGYKITTASFSSMVSGSGSYSNFTGAGVTVNPSQSLTTQGTLVGTESDTDLGIDGEGWFVVANSSDSDVFYYTRAGDFSTDDEGYLVNSSGWYLQGYATDRDGSVVAGTSAASLEAINVNDYAGAAEATTELEVQAILPADAEIGDAFTVDAEVYDSLGTAYTLTLTYTKTAANTWEMTVDQPAYSSDGTTDTATTVTLTGSTVTSNVATITFNEDGTLLTPADDIVIGISGWSSGGATSSIAYSCGTADATDGLSQYATGDGTADPTLTLTAVTQDGLRFGEFTSVSVDSSGYVYANFDNGISYTIYKIPLATFANDNGLEAESGTVYAASIYSGEANLVEADSGSAGAIESGELESSTVDTATEFSSLIVAQQAYSAASEIISTVSDMYDELMAAKR
ncbi:flagellar hook protein FlgE [Oleispirillum naphthae]|uniref:flagellar hook protein FlgE n=1 Tax=Oleispirillum naphthae TaxID=2838853 RepID=UPI0030824A09